MKQCKPTKTWQKTRLQNLLRHKSGRYYARAFAGGKELWKSLKTSHFSVAEAKLAEFLKDHRQRRNNSRDEVSAKMTFGEAAAIHLRDLDDNLSIKPGTRYYWRQRLAALSKSWPGLNETEVRKITPTNCKKWASTYAKTASPTNYNNTVALLRSGKYAGRDESCNNWRMRRNGQCGLTVPITPALLRHQQRDFWRSAHLPGDNWHDNFRRYRPFARKRLSV